MASVTFDTVVGGDGSTVTDDDDPSTGLGNGGALLRLVPMMANVVNVANDVIVNASAADSDAIAAAASAATATAAASGITQLGTATGLQTTGAAVMVNAATPPSGAGKTLVTTSTTTAEWGTIQSTPDFLLINAGII